ncbi:MAG: DUF58 domain-containing protein [Rubrobacter sp.]|nr:DUF58 domain-containing protein [Rubrobacter sp.]
MRRLLKPGLLCALGGVLYLIATNTGAGWLYVVSAGIGAVLLLSAIATLWSVSSIEVSRKAPARGVAGEPLPCSLTVHNRGRLHRYLLELRDSFGGESGGGVAVRVAGGEAAEVRYMLESPRRGVYRDGEVRVESAAPFGLFYGRRRIRASSGTTVYPRTFEVARLPDSGAGARGDHSDASSRRGSGGELWGVRDYRPGDPARLVAWRRSARSLSGHPGRLAVVELAEETRPPLSVALDLDPRAPAAAREVAVSAGASLLLRALADGREVGAGAGPENAPLPDGADREGVLSWCAGLQASGPPAPGSSVEVVPTLRGLRPPGAGTVVLVSCYEFAGPGPWMTAQEEREHVARLRADGRRAVLLGPDVAEPLELG